MPKRGVSECSFKEMSLMKVAASFLTSYHGSSQCHQHQHRRTYSAEYQHAHATHSPVLRAMKMMIVRVSLTRPYRRPCARYSVQSCCFRQATDTPFTLPVLPDRATFLFLLNRNCCSCCCCYYCLYCCCRCYCRRRHMSRREFVTLDAALAGNR